MTVMNRYGEHILSGSMVGIVMDETIHGTCADLVVGQILG